MQTMKGFALLPPYPVIPLKLTFLSKYFKPHKSHGKFSSIHSH